MGELEDSIKRHPAGVLRKVAEQSPHDLGWALAKAAELATVAEQSRIIKLLEQYYLETQIQADIRGQIITQSYSADLIALIKGENK